MDGSRFDDLARAVVYLSRRKVLKALVGGVLGGALGRQTAGAKSRWVGLCHQTRSATNPLVFIKVAENTVPAHIAHGDIVTDLQTDPNNCGACGNVCTGPLCIDNAQITYFCDNGVCSFFALSCHGPDPCRVDLCDPELGWCVHVLPDCSIGQPPCTTPSSACAGRDPVCEYTPVPDCCVGDADCDDHNDCTTDACDEGTHRCSHAPVNEGELCRRTFPCVGVNCGGICRAGACVCADGTELCGDDCADLQTDPNNCGGCNAPCAAGQTCCKGICADTASDNRNCGECGTICGDRLDPRDLCCAGTCFPRDEANCDHCGDVCASGQECGGSGSGGGFFCCTLIGNVCEPGTATAECCDGSTTDSALCIERTGDFFGTFVCCAHSGTPCPGFCRLGAYCDGCCGDLSPGSGFCTSDGFCE